MPTLAETNWECLGQPEFPWWAVICCAAGVALFIYGLILRRERALVPATEPVMRTVAMADRGASSTLFGFPLSLVALLAGIGIFGITFAWAGLDALKKHPHQRGLAGMLWTLAVLLATFWLFYLRVVGRLSRGRTITLIALRIIAVGLLVVELFQPTRIETSGAGAKAKLAVVIDASTSMGTTDEALSPTRYRKSTMAAQNTLTTLLTDRFDLAFFAYDGKHLAALNSAREYDAIPPEGALTDLPAAIKLAGSASPAQIILFSDGIHNGPTSIGQGLENFRVRVNPVLVGSSAETSNVPNITVTAAEAPLTATVNNEVIVTARLKSTALATRTAHVQLWLTGEGGSPAAKRMLDDQLLILEKSGVPQKVDFKFSPAVVGRASLEVRVPPDPDERNTADNAAQTSMLVTDTKLPVLYVEGRVRPEVGKLMRALATDPNVNAVSLVQVSAGNFTISGTKPGDDLRGLPTTLAQWKRFRVIILGDLDSSFLSTQQQSDLEQAVKEGAGLLMIGGQRSFAAGGWAKTKLADMLPVDLAKVEPAQINAPFVPQLTAFGANSAITRNITDFFGAPTGAPALKPLPQLLGCVAFAGKKPAAEILMEHPTEKINGKPAIVLAVQQYAQGRTAAFAADTTIQWTTAMAALGKDSPYNRFWGQMVRWLAGQEDLAKKSGPSVTSMLAKDRYKLNETVALKSAVTDKLGQSTQYAQAWAEITSPDGKTEHVPMGANKDQIGVYDGTYKPTMAGTYKIRFGASKDKLDLGHDDITFSINQIAAESERTAADEATMSEIARITHGRTPIGLEGIAKLADALIAEIPRDTLGTRTVTGLWHPQSTWPTPLALGHLLAIFFFAAIAAEWFLRRKWQLQ